MQGHCRGRAPATLERRNDRRTKSRRSPGQPGMDTGGQEGRQASRHRAGGRAARQNGCMELGFAGRRAGTAQGGRGGRQAGGQADGRAGRQGPHLGHGAYAHAQIPGRWVGKEVQEALGATAHLQHQWRAFTSAAALAGTAGRPGGTFVQSFSSQPQGHNSKNVRASKQARAYKLPSGARRQDGVPLQSRCRLAGWPGRPRMAGRCQPWRPRQPCPAAPAQRACLLGRPTPPHMLRCARTSPPYPCI